MWGLDKRLYGSYSKEPSREWIYNVVSTLITEQFRKYVQANIQKKNKDTINSQNIGISVTNEFIEIFKRSRAISTTKEKSNFLAWNLNYLRIINKIIAIEEEKNEIDNKAIFMLEWEFNDLK